MDTISVLENSTQISDPTEFSWIYFKDLRSTYNYWRLLSSHDVYSRPMKTNATMKSFHCQKFNRVWIGSVWFKDFFSVNKNHIVTRSPTGICNRTEFDSIWFKCFYAVLTYTVSSNFSVIENQINIRAYRSKQNLILVSLEDFILRWKLLGQEYRYTP